MLLKGLLQNARIRQVVPIGLEETEWGNGHPENNLGFEDIKTSFGGANEAKANENN